MFERVRLTVAGDVMLDIRLQGPVRRISPEAPVPIVELASREAWPGGAANVAMIAATLGARVQLIGATGVDTHADELQRIMESTDLRSRLVPDPSRVTTAKTRIVSGTQQICRIDHESRVPIDGSLESLLIEHIEAALEHSDVFILSDYGKGLFTDRVVRAVIAAAARHGVATLADPSGGDAARFVGADLIKPNRVEALAALSLPAGHPISVVELATTLRNSIDTGAVLVTDGGNGMALARRDETLLVSAPARSVIDVTGAGDAVAAVLGLGLGLGLELSEAVRWGTAAGSVAVTKPGTEGFRLDELTAARTEIHG